MAHKLVDILVKRLRQLASSFNEKPQVKVDDYVLEHFLLYHGLVGTSPENQRSFRDVRQDVLDAIRSASSSQMAIALKLPPLWWEDKLKVIFSEVEVRSAALYTLLPQVGDESWPSAEDPLGHSDWQVRANAANVLAFFDEKSADERLARSLHDTAGGAKAAFCHIAYALGRLGTARSKEALKQFLFSDEPWFRVDAAGALALCLDEEDKPDLMNALLDYHELSDYMAVVIGRRHEAASFLKDARENVKDGGCALVLGVLEAGKQTFTDEIIKDTKIASAFPGLAKLGTSGSSALRMRALKSLAQWISENWERARDQADQIPLREEVQKIASQPAADQVTEMLSRQLSRGEQLEHAIKLTADLNQRALAPQLISLLEKKSKFLDMTIDALGSLGDSQAAEPLINLARSTVDLADRTMRVSSKQPVFEENSKEAKTYWAVLKALGTLPSPDTVSLLLEATRDYAPDKREQALTSAVSCCLMDKSLPQRKEVEKAVAEALQDPSYRVRAVALEAAGQLELCDLIDQATKLVNAKEVSLSRQALKTLTHFHNLGHTRAVRTSVQERVQKESDYFKRNKLNAFLDTLPRQ